MLLTVTLNTAIDKLYTVEKLVPGEVTRVQTVSATPGGKGLNVSKVAALAGSEVCAMGFVGGYNGEWLLQLLEEQGLRLKNHKDCGLLLFDREKQTVGAGGSGCGCSAGVLCSHILPGLAKKELQRVLLVSTGALMSQIVWQQGESIPGVAHLVELCAQKVPDDRAGTLNYGEIKETGSGRNGGVV